jgi:hypothetical protein
VALLACAELLTTDSDKTVIESGSFNNNLDMAISL